MPITQISKIQLRRGKQQDLPQLASAEMGWAVDTQSLFIGNGSVAEGAPAVGNTKILTNKDNLLEVANNYQYALDPVLPKRSLASRLDDFVTNESLGIIDSESFQYALNKLAGKKTVLYFLPGTHTFENSVTVPSGISIMGSGVEKTIFEFTSEQALILEYSTAEIDNSDYSKSWHISDMTIRMLVPTYQGVYDSGKLYQIGEVVSYTVGSEMVLGTYTEATSGSTPQSISYTNGIIVLNSVINSKFIDLKIEFKAESTGHPKAYSNHAIMANSISGMVNCHNNTFERIICYYSKNGIFSDVDNYFNDNVINNCVFDLVINGVKLKGISNRNKISNNTFKSINTRAVDIYYGSRNILTNNSYIGSITQSLPPVHFGEPGNAIVNDHNDRIVPISEGVAVGYEQPFSESLSVPETSNITTLFNLPYLIGSSIKINYTLSGDIAFRKGTMTILIDKSEHINLYDEYDYHGTTTAYDDDLDTNDPITSVKFTASKSAILNGFYTLQIQYTSSASETLTIVYNYSFL